MTCSCGRLYLPGLELRQPVQQHRAVVGVDMTVFADDVADGGRVGFAVVAQPDALRITLFVAEVVVGVSHLRVFGDKAEQRFEFREPVLRLAEFRVVDVDEQVVGDFARVVVETPDAGRPVDVAAPAGVVIASGFRKIVACGEVRTPAFADAVLDLGREVGVVENAESPDACWIGYAEHFQIAGVDVHQMPCAVVYLDADRGVLNDVAQQFLLFVERLMRRDDVRDVEDQDHDLRRVVGGVVEEAAAVAAGFGGMPLVHLVIPQPDGRQLVDVPVYGDVYFAGGLVEVIGGVYAQNLLRRLVDREEKVVGRPAVVVEQPDAEVADRQVVEQLVHVFVLLQHRVIVAFEREDVRLFPAGDRNALEVAEEFDALLRVRLFADELRMDPYFAFRQYDGERFVEMVSDLERQEFVVYPCPVIFARQRHQFPDCGPVAAESQQIDDVVGEEQFARAEIRLPPPHLGRVEQLHQRLKIGSAGGKHNGVAVKCVKACG